MSNKPRVFIGSSSEGLDFARAIEEQIVGESEPVLWTNAFDLSSTTIESLEKAVADVEFAILILTPDDMREKRGEIGKVPRDNVLFEIGLFLGKLGRDRTFIVADAEDMELPTDLLGITVASFNSKRSNGNALAAVSPAASKIIRSIKKTPRKSSLSMSHRLETFLVDEDQLLNAVASWPGNSKGIKIVLQNTKWIWKIFPTLLIWRLKNIRVEIVAPPPKGEDRFIRQEQARRNLLKELGVKATETNNLEIVGFFRNAEYTDECSAIIINKDPSDFEPLAVHYDGRVHAQALSSLMALTTNLTDTSQENIVAPMLKSHQVNEVILKLRAGVHQYSSTLVQLEPGKVKTKDLYLMSPFARAYKYKQILNLYEAYKSIGIEPFEPLAVYFASGKYSIVTPPIVEMSAIGPVVIEGTTRATFCRESKIEEFFCIKVRGVVDALPGKPVPIGEVTIAERSLAPGDRMENFEYTRFRHIERAVHPY